MKPAYSENDPAKQEDSSLYRSGKIDARVCTCPCHIPPCVPVPLLSLSVRGGSDILLAIREPFAIRNEPHCLFRDQLPSSSDREPIRDQCQGGHRGSPAEDLQRCGRLLGPVLAKGGKRVQQVRTHQVMDLRLSRGSKEVEIHCGAPESQHESHQM